MNKLVICLAFLFGTTVFVSAQQTIFNVPTMEVLDHGKVYLELDACGI
ncbi:MAG: hypothetical protein ABJB40_00135 [Acidobacteriota bacterium]